MGPENGDQPRVELESVDEVLKRFNTSFAAGLSTEEVERRRAIYGWNELEKEDPTPLWKLVVEQFEDVLVKILLAAAVVSFLLAFFDDEDEGDAAYIEPAVILTILILNAIVGVWQESNAEAALEALKDLQPEFARVRRDACWKTVEARELIVGDIVEVRVGDKVPGDIRLISRRTSMVRVEQSQLTGESQSVDKEIDELPKNTENVIQAKTNMMFAASIVVGGCGMGVVTGIGMNTEIGHVQRSVKEAAEEDESTPLKKKLDEFGELLSKVIGIICIVVWVINYKNFFDPAHGTVFRGSIYYFKIAVALAVAAIPEGLPAVITTCLALGTRKMAKKNAIVRKLPSVETLGCTTVICSDKTGTLTTNEMSCVAISHPSNTQTVLNSYLVKGHTYAPIGKIEGFEKDGLTPCRIMLAQICALCNESTIEYKEDRYVRVGEPTEASLRVLVEKMGVPEAKLSEELEKGRKSSPGCYAQFCNDYWKSKFDVVATLEFSRDRKSMSVLCRPTDKKDSNNILLVKGAPEGIVARCSNIMLQDGSIQPITEETKSIILNEVSTKASKALRCLGFAYKLPQGDLATFDGSRYHPAQKFLSDDDHFLSIESDLTFVGLSGIMDPPRPEVKGSIDICRTAGIRVTMITGDNQLTAEQIARQIGIFTQTEDVTHKSFTGSEFFSFPEEKQIQYLTESDSGLVFSRTEPKHKQKLVRLLKKQGEVVAMTGDGVNDAPALKQADIGVAMGMSGTEVAKEASDMVLADDNFATIVSAVEEGRAIYNNTQAFIRYLISSNIGEVASIFITAALGMPEGLIPVQLLWVNLVTDGPPATALGFNPPDNDIMKKLPRRADDVLINGWVFFRYMVVGTYVGVACVGIFAYWYMYYDWSGDGHTLITFDQLTHWSECQNWSDFQVNNFDGMDFSEDPCLYFTEGKVTPSTLSLSVLVVIEMLNALNALSEDGSLLTMPPWANPYLLIAMIFSIGMHFFILYVDAFATMFKVKPLDTREWTMVLAFSAPVILIDEILKAWGRKLDRKQQERRASFHGSGKKDL